MYDIKSFCNKNGLYTDMNILREYTEIFISEMEAGLNGSGSLKMLPSYIDPSSLQYSSRKAIVIDAGGTNLRVALVSFTENLRPEIEYFKNHPMPGTQGEIDADGFFDLLASHIEPVADKAERIGFCFSYPAVITPERDARLMNFTKEVRVSGMEGLSLSNGLHVAMKSRGLPSSAPITVLNDTVAALLGGIAAAENRIYDGFVGIILGTGTNTCYIEENRNIRKDSYLTSKEGRTIVNLESGGYARAPRSAPDLSFDAKTGSPGVQLFEKMISGAYAGPLFLEFMKAAAEENCFSEEATARIRETENLTGFDIDMFCMYPYGKNVLAKIAGGCEETIQSLYFLTDAFFERVASLVTANLAGILKKVGAGNIPYKPICISAEGTTFYKAKLLKPKLDYYMEHYVRRELGLNYEFVKVENCTLLGTAIAGLL